MMKSTRLYCISFLVVLLFFSFQTYASTPAISVVTTEYISQIIAYDQVYGGQDSLVEAPGELGENRTGESRTNVTLSDTSIRGFLNISNVEIIGNQTISSINVTINGTEDILSWSLMSPVPAYLQYSSSVNLANPGGATETDFFISELRAGDSVLFNFTVNSSTYVEPLNFTEWYSDWKVLTGRSVNVTLNVTNQFPLSVAIYDLEILKTPQPYPSEQGGFTFFSYAGIRGDDSANARIFVDGDGKTILNWTPTGGLLAKGDPHQIIFNATAPVNISVNWSESYSWSSWMNMGNLSATFKINGSITGFSIRNVTGVSTAARIAVTKERINESFYWNSSLNLTNTAPAPLDYELRQISVWATKAGEYANPGDLTSWINKTSTTATSYGSMTNVYANATWFPRINFSAGSTVDNYSITFNYSLVPIVWATADFVILDDGTQIFSINKTQSSLDEPYLFIEEIYVLLGGYLMKVTKTFDSMESPTASNRYSVNITLENIGTEKTPDLVTVFDLLPTDFNPLFWSTNTSASRSDITGGSIIRISDKSGDINKRLAAPSLSDFVMGSGNSGLINSGPYSGYWGYHIDLESFEAPSNGNGLYDPALSTKEVLIRYKMEGNNSLARIENAYVVGVDPVRLEGASPSQSVASRLSISSSMTEIIILLSTLILSASMLVITFMMMREVKR